MSRQVAILSGGDWYDASVDHLTVPDDMNLDSERKLHDEWFKTVYHTSFDKYRRKEIDSPPKYITLVEWLRLHGATDSTVEIFDDCP